MKLNGKGFILRNWLRTDASALQKHADNVKIAACLLDHFPSPYTFADAEFFINLKINENPITNFPIVIDGDACGVIGIDNWGDDKPLLGYWLSEQHWGKGIVTEAVKLFTDYAVNHLGINQLYAEVANINTASQRVLEKAYYTQTNILKNDLKLRGEILNRHIFTYKL